MSTDQEQLEALWRTALALGGSEGRADFILDRVFRRVWDPLRTSDSRLLRQIVNESRTGGSWSGPNTAALGPQLGPAVAALSVPVREAWLLRDLCAKPHADAMRAIEIEQNETLRPSELDALAARGEEHLRAALGDRYEALVLAGRDALAHADARAGWRGSKSG